MCVASDLLELSLPDDPFSTLSAAAILCQSPFSAGLFSVVDAEADNPLLLANFLLLIFLLLLLLLLVGNANLLDSLSARSFSMSCHAGRYRPRWNSTPTIALFTSPH